MGVLLDSASVTVLIATVYRCYRLSPRERQCGRLRFLVPCDTICVTHAKLQNAASYRSDRPPSLDLWAHAKKFDRSSDDRPPGAVVRGRPLSLARGVRREPCARFCPVFLSNQDRTGAVEGEKQAAEPSPRVSEFGLSSSCYVACVDRRLSNSLAELLYLAGFLAMYLAA